MEQERKPTKNQHLVLQSLLNKPGTLEQLKAVANPSGSQISLPRVKSVVFDSMLSAGWVTLAEGTYSITPQGAFATNQKSRKLAAKIPAASVVPGKLFVATGNYDGAELKRVAYRPGAFDYLDCPSLINGTLKPYLGGRNV